MERVIPCFLQVHVVTLKRNTPGNISTGVHAHATANVDKAEAVERTIPEDMEGKTVRVQESVTLDCKHTCQLTLFRRDRPYYFPYFFLVYFESIYGYFLALLDQNPYF